MWLHENRATTFLSGSLFLGDGEHFCETQVDYTLWSKAAQLIAISSYPKNSLLDLELNKSPK